MTIFGITGTLGAGKGTVTKYLIEKKGFVHYSARAFIVEEIEKRGLPVNRDTMTLVANDLRKNNSPSYIVEQLLNQAQEIGKNAVIESIRTVGEAELLRSAGALLISVDADQKSRYERIKARQNESDHVSFEKFVEQEDREMNSTDPTKQNIHAVIEMADIKLENNGTIEELENALEQELEKKSYRV